MSQDDNSVVNETMAVLSPFKLWLNVLFFGSFLMLFFAVRRAMPSWGSLQPLFFASAVIAVLISVTFAGWLYFRLRAGSAQDDDRRVEAGGAALGVLLGMLTGGIILFAPLSYLCAMWINQLLSSAPYQQVPCKVVDRGRAITGRVVLARCALPAGREVEDTIETGGGDRVPLVGATFTYPLRRGRLGLWLRDPERLDPWRGGSRPERGGRDQMITPP